MENPFNITKAVDYTDKELNEFWVDFPGIGFNDTIKPTSEMPMIIKGSKGSGKTHIMKHFSLTMQKLRHSENLLEGVKKDGYVGTYLRCSGLNAYKFTGRGEDDQTWETLFAFYLELWLGQLILNNISSFFSSTKTRINEKIIIENILTYFTFSDGKPEINTIEGLVNYLNKLQKEIDYSINNKALTNKKISESIEITLNPGSLIFGIPKVLSEKVEIFSDLKFLYLLDEFENFTESQQKYFNTLIRERKSPTCFKVGTRRYGIRTKATLSANEEIKSGSEYEEIDIDEIFRSNQHNYSDFLKDICIKRLKHQNLIVDKKMFADYFEDFCEKDLMGEIIQKGERHFKRFEKKIEKLGLGDQKKTICKNLRFRKNPILERCNIYLFYRAWKRGIDLFNASKEIKRSCQLYSLGKPSEFHEKIMDKYKNDIIDALCRENNIKLKSYIGFENLVRMSNGIPRHFLIVMKHIHRWNEFYSRKAFLSTDPGSLINSESQLNAIRDTANWFFEDAQVPGKEGNKIKDVLERLCDYLRELRFSDLPRECSISSFSIDLKVIPQDLREILNFLEQYSYLLRIGSGRRDKNYNSRNQTFQINGLLAVEWELSLTRRGIVNFSRDEVFNIFIPNKDGDYKTMKNSNLPKYNTPFPYNPKFPSLFD